MVQVHGKRKPRAHNVSLEPLSFSLILLWIALKVHLEIDKVISVHHLPPP